MLTTTDVLSDARWVVDRARHLRVNSEAVKRWAERFAGRPFEMPVDDPDLVFGGSLESSADFILLTDALNFCFWADDREGPVAEWAVEYKGRRWTRTLAMVAGVLKAAEHDGAWLTAERWSSATRDDVVSMFAGEGEIPLLDKRVEVIVETGTVLSEKFGGRFINAVEQVGRRADELASLLAENFGSFRDVADYDGRCVVFMKRAQICAADLHRLWTANRQGELLNMERLTVFADYRLPQLFRHEGMIEASSELAGRIERKEIIEAGSAEEVELRAATILVSQMLVDEMVAMGQTVTAWELDYDLWLRARRPEVSVPHHRTITCFY